MSTNHMLNTVKKNGAHAINNAQDTYEGILGSVQGAALKGKRSFLRFKRAANDAIFEGTEKVKDTAVQINRQVRKNPWPVIAGAATCALVVGFLVGRAGKKQWE